MFWILHYLQLYFSAGSGDTCNDLQISNTLFLCDNVLGYHSLSPFSFPMNSMVLSSKDILCPKDISEKKADCGHLMGIRIVLDLVGTKILRCKIEFQFLHVISFQISDTSPSLSKFS